MSFFLKTLLVRHKWQLFKGNHLCFISHTKTSRHSTLPLRQNTDTCDRTFQAVVIRSHRSSIMRKRTKTLPIKICISFCYCCSAFNWYYAALWITNYPHLTGTGDANHIGSAVCILITNTSVKIKCFSKYHPGGMCSVFCSVTFGNSSPMNNQWCTSKLGDSRWKVLITLHVICYEDGYDEKIHCSFIICLREQINENINLYPFKFNGYVIHFPGQLKI